MSDDGMCRRAHDDQYHLDAEAGKASRLAHDLDAARGRRTAIAKALVAATVMYGPGALNVYPDDFLAELRRQGFDVRGRA